MDGHQKQLIKKAHLIIHLYTTYLFMNVNQTLDDLPEQPPGTVHVLIKTGVYTVPEGALLTVLHLYTRTREWMNVLMLTD